VDGKKRGLPLLSETFCRLTKEGENMKPQSTQRSIAATKTIITTKNTKNETTHLRGGLRWNIES